MECKISLGTQLETQISDENLSVGGRLSLRSCKSRIPFESRRDRFVVSSQSNRPMCGGPKALKAWARAGGFKNIDTSMLSGLQNSLTVLNEVKFIIT